MSDIRHDYIVEGMKPRDLYKKYLPLCSKPFTKESLAVLMTRAGMPAERRILDEQREELREAHKKKLTRSVEKRDGKALSEEVRKVAIDRERKAQEKHTKRMAKQADRAYGAIRKIEPGPDDVREFVGTLNDFDKLARRLYNMDDKAELSSHQWNIAILVNQDKLQGEVPEAIEAELVEE